MKNWTYTPEKFEVWPLRMKMFLARHDNQPKGFLARFIWGILK